MTDLSRLKYCTEMFLSIHSMQGPLQKDWKWFHKSHCTCKSVANTHHFWANKHYFNSRAYLQLIIWVNKPSKKSPLLSKCCGRSQALHTSQRSVTCHHSILQPVLVSKTLQLNLFSLVIMYCKSPEITYQSTNLIQGNVNPHCPLFTPTPDATGRADACASPQMPAKVRQQCTWWPAKLS